ncbi:MAG: protein yceI precursor [Desulfuromonadales bacterium GWD2_61_12]|nr:MAG: protein yceI precursor [Desulfuromonadales bacterium GWD2_61_12]HAD03470.1 protein yceI precursor [Desulfuromonas sp.]HBT82591.1 protein yceI precursor [Desulfuromonas sp.]
MKRIRIALAALVLLPGFAGAATYTIDPEHTSIQFKVRHMMATNVVGAFQKFDGTVELDDKDISKSKVAITIDTASLNSYVAKRDEHLRSPDFFDVAKYPTMTFVSQNVVADGAGKLKITGDLTIRGITKRVLLDVEGPSAESKDPWGNLRRGASATTKIYRQDFGLNWNAALETGGFAVGDEVLITLEVEMIKAK